MQVDAGPSLTDRGIIGGENQPLAPDRAQTTKYRTPTTLSRSSLPTQPPVIARTSSNNPGSLSDAPALPAALSVAGDLVRPSRPALARVSAHDFPNLSRASQLSAVSMAMVSSASGLCPQGVHVSTFPIATAGSAGDPRRTNLRRSSIVKTEQELARRAQGPVDVGMTICVTDVESGKQIAYKADGSRFAASQYTVKMVMGHTYRFVITINEEFKLVDESIVLTYTNSKGEVVKEPVECEQTERGFAADWTCTIGASKKGERTTMELMLPLEDYGNCRLPLVLKAYPSNKEKAVAAGILLKSIILTYRADNGKVKTIKEAWVNL